MALPTVVHTHIPAATNSSLNAPVGRAIHALLVAAGWTPMYVSPVAIGTGTSENPQWDATPVINTSTGYAIYRMPLNGFTRQWFMRIELAWGASITTALRIDVRIGTDWNGVSELTGAGSTFQFLTNATATANVVNMAASEDGFAFHHAGTAAGSIRWVLVERVRDHDGTVGDDVCVMGGAITGTFPGQNTYWGAARYRASDGLEYATGQYMLLARPSAFTTFASPTISTTGVSGETNVPLGPYAFVSEPQGVPRLILCLSIVDVVAGTDHAVYVDGGAKLYRSPGTLVASHYIPIVARE